MSVVGALALPGDPDANGPARQVETLRVIPDRCLAQSRLADRRGARPRQPVDGTALLVQQLDGEEGILRDPVSVDGDARFTLVNADGTGMA